MRIHTQVVGVVAVLMVAMLAVVLFAAGTRSMSVDAGSAAAGPVALAAMY